MELLGNLWLGLQVAADPINLLYCFFGVFLGTVVGVLPGIGALAAISLLLPLTYHIEPTAAIIMLAPPFYMLLTSLKTSAEVADLGAMSLAKALLNEGFEQQSP